MSLFCCAFNAAPNSVRLSSIVMEAGLAPGNLCRSSGSSGAAAAKGARFLTP